MEITKVLGAVGLALVIVFIIKFSVKMTFRLRLKGLERELLARWHLLPTAAKIDWVLAEAYALYQSDPEITGYSFQEFALLFEHCNQYPSEKLLEAFTSLLGSKWEALSSHRPVNIQRAITEQEHVYESRRDLAREFRALVRASSSPHEARRLAS